MRVQVQNSKGYALFLAVLPVIMMYKVPGIGLSVTTVLIALGMAYAFLVIVAQIKKIRIGLIAPLVLYLAYVVTKSTGQNMLLMFAILIHITAISTGVVDVAYLRRVIEWISIVAAVLLIIQSVVHLLTGEHIPMIHIGFMIDELADSKQAILTGYHLGESMYRPAAFFLEPSHFAQYCAIGLGSLLFHSIPEHKKATLVSIGILLTTSGMGFVLVFAMWGWWYIARYEEESLPNKVKKVVFSLLGVCIVFAVLSQFPFFQEVIARFAVSEEESGGYNAIHGRLFWWETYFGGLTWKDLLLGFGTASLPENYFTGFMTQLYAYGIIGFGLLIVSLLVLLKKGNTLSRTYTLIYMAMLFISNLTGFINIIFRIGIIVSLICSCKEIE